VLKVPLPRPVLVEVLVLLAVDPELNSAVK
jgi:hypothetical protein